MSTDARWRLIAASVNNTIRKENFDGAELTSISMTHWFHRCSFIGTDLRHATLDRCHFLMCDLTGAKFRGASLRGASFSACNLRDADLRNTDLRHARFDSMMTGADNAHTDLTGAQFDGAKVLDVEASQAIGWPF